MTKYDLALKLQQVEAERDNLLRMVEKQHRDLARLHAELDEIRNLSPQ
jgi:hypothetical protein